MRKILDKLKRIKYPKVIYGKYDYIIREKCSKEEISKAWNEAKLAYRMSSVEYLRYKEFCNEHSHNELDLVHPHLWVGVLDSGIGPIFQCRCDVCNKIFDITEITEW